MPDKQAIAFTATLTEREWDKDVSGWRCPVLKIPGAKVEDLFLEGRRVDRSSYEVNYELGVVRWVTPEAPGRATAFIRLTEELSTRDLTQWWKKFAIVVPIITTLITALAAGGFSYLSRQSTPPDKPPGTPAPAAPCDKTVRILVPADMQRVPLREEVKGTYQDLPPRHRIWTLIYPPSIRRFYPQSEADVVGNTWSSKVLVGLDQEAGRTFLIYVVLADENGHNALKIYQSRAVESGESPGLIDLPAGVQICQLIQVIRK